MLAAIYILVASGLSLVMGVAKIFNLAHTGFYMLGAFVCGLIYGTLLPNWIIASLLAILSVDVLAIVTYWLIFRRLRSKPFFVVVASVGVYMIFVQVIVVIFGERELIVPPVFRGAINLGGIALPFERIMLVVFSLLAMLSLYFLLKTKIGKAMHATALDEEAAVLQGIHSDRICLIAMITGCSLAAFAGAVICPIFGAQAHMGTHVLVLILLVVVVGGQGSIKGSILTGLIIGIAESFGNQFISGGSLLAIFVASGIVIYLRPGGLFGTVHEWE